MAMEKSYEPKLIEEPIYHEWLNSGSFKSSPDNRSMFSLVIPPPNVTGSLHVGHALDLTLQDILIRWNRMVGKNTLWVPGTDHAGIATQMVVERELAKENKKRQEIGRKAFEERVWQWKEYSHDRIVHQIHRLGLSCDWSRERFTLDEGLSRAVRTAFVRLYNEGLIYKGQYIVNWCPRCKTAVSDLEVRHETKEGQLYHVRYPVKGTPEFITVATTRPETMLGDTAVAVHPGDSRYSALVGKTAVLPLLNREIPIITDEFVDREFGSGAVKLTPAHDPNDFAAAQRNNIPAILVIDGDAKITAAGGPYAGLDRYEARERVVEDLTKLGLIAKVEKHTYSIGHCDRCKTVVEPLLSTQWFCKMKPLADPAIRAVEEGRTRFFPENWEKTYFEWMRNIHDWCISRQLWWGHRIPAWYCDDCNTINVAVDPPAQCSKCGGTKLRQETDVLDTWFSSGLWPFSVFGWPEATPELQYYYPTSTLVTGFDIIFFWVARMMMFGLKFMNDVPFRHCYIHGLVRDEHGQKMSKSKGNALDPMELIDEYGADPLRFTLAVLAVPGPDIPLAPKRIAGYKAFINKLWNSVRFALLKLNEGEDLKPLSREHWDIGDRWIASRMQTVAGEINQAIGEYRFDLAANAAYQFLWYELCDWYVEWIKPHLNDGVPHASARKGLLLQRICDVLRLLHPIVPFVTEYLWKQIPESVRPASLLVTASYPQPDAALQDPEAEHQFAVIMELVGKIRQVRSEMNIDPGRRVSIYVRDAADPAFLRAWQNEILILTRGERMEVVNELPPNLRLARGVLSHGEIGIDLSGVLDINAETERLTKELKKIETELNQVQKKLDNENFLRNAKPEVVEEQKAKQADLVGRKQRSEAQLAALR